jgi:hypothetical protein
VTAPKDGDRSLPAVIVVKAGAGNFDLLENNESVELQRITIM